MVARRRSMATEKKLLERPSLVSPPITYNRLLYITAELPATPKGRGKAVLHCCDGK
uniref:Uncharacterized protein n=1 Tax=Amphimedon queenslandica TaxID=400682 RepID=A0A1X7VTN3_AMPQE